MAKSKRRKKNKKLTTISEMCGSRGVMPPPTVADAVKKKKVNRQKVKEKLKKGQYDDY